MTRGKSSLPDTKKGELQKLWGSFSEKDIDKAGYRYKVITELQLHSH